MITDYPNRIGSNLAPKAKNDPAQVKCRVLKATFFLQGKVPAVGDIVTLSRFDATNLAATKKVEILKG